MANEIVYKHPDAQVVEETDFTADLPNDTTLAAVDPSGTTYKLFSSAGVDITDAMTPTDILTVSLAISGSEPVLQYTLGAGTDGEDYQLELKGQGGTSTVFAVRVIEVRVRGSMGNS